jgi:hypothetical protein
MNVVVKIYQKEIVIERFAIPLIAKTSHLKTILYGLVILMLMM